MCPPRAVLMTLLYLTAHARRSARGSAPPRRSLGRIKCLSDNPGRSCSTPAGSASGGALEPSPRAAGREGSGTSLARGSGGLLHRVCSHARRSTLGQRGSRSLRHPSERACREQREAAGWHQPRPHGRDAGGTSGMQEEPQGCRRNHGDVGGTVGMQGDPWGCAGSPDGAGTLLF